MTVPRDFPRKGGAIGFITSSDFDHVGVGSYLAVLCLESRGSKASFGPLGRDIF